MDGGKSTNQLTPPGSQRLPQQRFRLGHYLFVIRIDPFLFRRVVPYFIQSSRFFSLLPPSFLEFVPFINRAHAMRIAIALVNVLTAPHVQPLLFERVESTKYFIVRADIDQIGVGTGNPACLRCLLLQRFGQFVGIDPSLLGVQGLLGPLQHLLVLVRGG